MKDEIIKMILNGEAVRLSLTGTPKEAELLYDWLRQFKGSFGGSREVLNCNATVGATSETRDIRVGSVPNGLRQLLAGKMSELTQFEIKIHEGV